MSFARAAEIIVRNRARERKGPGRADSTRSPQAEVRRFRPTPAQEVPPSNHSEQGSTVHSNSFDDRSQVNDFSTSTTVPKYKRHTISLSEVSTVIAEAPFKTNEALTRRHHRERLALGVMFTVFVVFSAWHLLHRFRNLHASLSSYQEVAEEFTRKQPFNYNQLKQGNVDFETVQRDLITWNQEYASLQAQVETRFGGIFEHSSFDGELEIKPVDDDGTENEDPTDDEDQLTRNPKTTARKAHKSLGPEKKSKLLIDKTSSLYISWFLLFTVICVAASFLIERDNDNREARVYDWVALLCIFSLIPIICQAKLIEDSFDQALENLRWVSYMLVAQGGTPQTTYEFQLQMLCLKKLDIMATYWEAHDLTLRVSIPIVGWSLRESLGKETYSPAPTVQADEIPEEKETP
ncbi:hypothetical protein CYMTET_28743 [Cymbomonas tetramitiformis]|uniref:Uncharacterized protein n=1 Tax=Cymbomonas tetramitiformis TaxID=36881 RepID=A0AAE0KVL5_9CHLO|nr:hypothetical protein CYMTET_28743 [Cymbomonas tetramitiformis]